MKFLANENFPAAGVRLLRKSGYEVAAVIEETPGAEDKDIVSSLNIMGKCGKGIISLF